mmetsp:Transcript_24742/g.72449  ORF Transcript_24742/g.72449 Transcript_24742/m.72449 type:complete len:82 (-) Transcript_24742:1411-1656(-)
MVAPKEEDLVWEEELHSEEVGDALQALHAPIDEVAQEDEVPGGEGHTQPPHIVTEKVKILEIAMDVTEHIGGALEEGHSRL